MSDSPLTTTPATGSQTSTQNPQTAGNSGASGTPTSAVQPGSVGSLDTATGGVPLTNHDLSTVALPTRSSVVTKAEPLAHHRNPLTTGISVVLFLAAIILVVSIFLPAKNTTN